MPLEATCLPASNVQTNVFDLFETFTEKVCVLVSLMLLLKSCMPVLLFSLSVGCVLLGCVLLAVRRMLIL